MINQLKFANGWNRSVTVKLVLLFFILGLWLMPGYLLHILAVIAHTLYESIAIVIEELLVEVFGFTKFQAQMTLFYTSLAIGIFGTITLIRRIPKMLANARLRVIQKYTEARDHWKNLPTQQKAGLMIVQFFSIFTMLAFLIS